MRIFTSILALWFVALTSFKATAQTPFWTEDFTNGIPASWSNVDLSNQGAVWTWCNNPAGGNTPGGCPGIFNDAVNGQVPFASNTASTGFATLDSDEYGSLNSDHLSALTTSAINCSGKSQVFVTFQSHIGVYTVPAETGAVLRVSTNNSTWTSFTVFPGLTTDVRWSANPEYSIIDISSVAANSATVYVQWYWDGNYEYQWNLDDIAIYDQNPTPANNLKLETVFYAPSSYAQPVSQIASDIFGFYAGVTNAGTDPQTGVKLYAWITDATNAILYADSTEVDILEPGVADSILILPGSFTPALPVGEYGIHYAVISNEQEGTPADNQYHDNFLVTNNLYSKENGAGGGLRPGGGGDYYVANIYGTSASNLDTYKAVEADFSCAANSTDLFLPDAVAYIYVFRIADTVAADYANFSNSTFFSPSLEWIGYTEYEFPDTAASYDLFTAPLLDANTSEPGLTLDPGARYLLAIGYVGTNNKIFHAFNDDRKYLFVSTAVFTSQWFLGGFGEEDAAVARMRISLVTTKDNTPLAESAFKVFPNPATDRVVLAANFENPTDADITIAQLDGKVIEIIEKRGITSENVDYNVSNLASGMYIARIATKEGTKTLKFVVQK